MGLALSSLSAAIFAAQFRRHASVLQWIFPCIIMGILFIISAVTFVATWSSNKFKRRASATEEKDKLVLVE